MEKMNNIKNLFNKTVQNIYKQNNQIIVKFEDGSEMPLIDPQGEIYLNIPYCNFCGDPGDDNHPLFTINGEHYICPKCVSLAVKTFLENDVNVEIELGEKFNDLGEQITLFDETFKTYI